MNHDNKANEDFRRVLATATKLESIQSNLDSVIDFFLVPITKLYAKLCNDCLKLLFGNGFKLDYFRKAEELVWRRVYHDIYRFQKNNRSNIKKQDGYLMESHFISGIGFYSSLIIKLRSHYKISEVNGMIGPLNLSFGPIDNFACNRRLNNDDNDQCENTIHDNSMSIDESLDLKIDDVAKEWARQAIYRSLVYMGDLARYLIETSQFDFRNLAFKLYLSASRNQPDHGLPFNQLATLAGGMNYNLDAVCNYMRCSLKPKPFEGAEGNMKKIFELNRKFLDEIRCNGPIISYSEVLSSKNPGSAAESLVRAVIVTFIGVVSDLRAAICDNADQCQVENIIQETRLFFETLREALELDPTVPMESSGNLEQDLRPISCGASSPNKLRYISPTIIYEMCSMSLMLIAECQKRKALRVTLDPIQDNIMDLVNTLALNLLHYATNKCYKMVIAKVQELRIRRSDLSVGNESLMRSSYSNYSIRSSENLNSQSNSISKRTKSRVRQKKAAATFSDHMSGLKPLARQSDDSDLSELEETALSTIDALEISSGMSEEVDHEAVDLIDLSSASDEEQLFIENRRKIVGSAISLRAEGAMSRPAVRQTKSQNYEMLRVNDNNHSSLPVPDLLTGDNLNEVFSDNQSPLGSKEGSDRPLSRSSTRRNSFRSNEECEFELVMSHIYTHTYLPTLKILCDWLLADSSVINSNLSSFREFCNELNEIVTSLDDLRKLIQPDCCNTSARETFEEKSCHSPIFKHAFDGPRWTQRYPLSCDLPLFFLSPLRNVHERNIDTTYADDLTNSESGFITIQCVVAFSHALVAFLDNKNI